MLFLRPLFLAASAAAIFVPPEVSEDEVFRALPIENNVPVQLPPEMLARNLSIACKGCPDPETKLNLNLAIEDNHRLTMNGYQLYPELADRFGGQFIDVLTSDGQVKKEMAQWSSRACKRLEDGNTQVHVIDYIFEIFYVGDHYVKLLPVIYVNLIEVEPLGDVQIGLLIFDVAIEEPQDFFATPGGADAKNKGDASNQDPDNEDGKPSCESVWCLAKGKIEDAWKKVKGGIKGCGGMRGHGHKGDHKHGDHKHGDHKHGGHKHGGHKHGGHNHHGGSKDQQGLFQHRSWGSMLKNVVGYIILPLILGIAAGVGVAVLAMFIGNYVFRFFSYMWAGQHQAPVSSLHKAADLESAIVDGEKSGLMADQEPPPEYEEENTSK